MKFGTGAAEPASDTDRCERAAYILEREVEVQTLSKALEESGLTSVDLLQIDTEGSDLLVIESLDFSRYSPEVIFIEYKHLSATDRTALRDRLLGLGYTIDDCGGDFFARRKQPSTSISHRG